MLDFPLDVARSFTANYPEFPDSCLLFDLPFLVDVLAMLVDGPDVLLEQFRSDGVRSRRPQAEGRLPTTPCLQVAAMGSIPSRTSRLSQKQWDLAKVNIQREELKPVLQGNRCDPDVIAWNGPAFLAQVYVHLRVPQRGFFGYVQDADRWLTQELRQLRRVLRPAIARPESAV